MNPATDLKGRRFARLAVIERAGKDKRGRAMWRCRCDCGGEKIVRGDQLRRGDNKSCGCLQTEARLQFGAKCGGSRQPARAPKPGAPARHLTGFDADEAAAIAAAVAAGKVVRIPNGSWPDVGRLDGGVTPRASQVRGSARGGRSFAASRRMAARSAR